MLEIAEILGRGLAAEVLFNEPMHSHTTFKIGGPADVFVRPKTTDELAFAISACHSAGAPYFVLGNGSNLLVKDNGIRGVVISLMSMDKIEHKDEIICARAGVLLSSLSKFALAQSLTGLEFAEGIPGSVGGGIAMNAGAYGGEIAQVFDSADVIDIQGNLQKFTLNDMDFSYRKSAVQQQGHIVAAAAFKLNRGHKGKIANDMEEHRKARTSKQPLEMPSAGSTFRRPPGKFAGKLIMDSGLRGYRIGGAGVSEKHCGFVVNHGGATAADVLAVMGHIQDTVQKKFGIMLVPEVKIVGE